MKWLWSLLGFLSVVIFVSALTTNVFINAIDEGYANAKQTVTQRSIVFAEQGLNSTYPQMTAEQKASIQQISSLSVEQRKQILTVQCQAQDMKTQPFCDSRFLEGVSFDNIVKDKLKTDFEKVMIQALDQVKIRLDVFSNCHLLIISIISGVLGLVFYLFAYGLLKGIQIYSGNVSWLSFLSAVSFKIMPTILNKMIAAMAANASAEAQNTASITKEILLSWLNPAINCAFMFSVVMTVISLIILLGIKLVRKYSA